MNYSYCIIRLLMNPPFVALSLVEGTPGAFEGFRSLFLLFIGLRAAVYYLLRLKDSFDLLIVGGDLPQGLVIQPGLL